MQSADLLRRIVESLTLVGMRLLARWPAVIASDNLNGTVGVQPDSDAVKGSGDDNATLLVGLPGMRVKVPAGTRVRYGFDAGDAQLPMVAGFEQVDSAGATEIKFDGGANAMARVHDKVQLKVTWESALAPDIVLTFTDPDGVLPPVVVPASVPTLVTGRITSGNTKLLA